MENPKFWYIATLLTYELNFNTMQRTILRQCKVNLVETVRVNIGILIV
jgi:hypothetical protein